MVINYRHFIKFFIYIIVAFARRVELLLWSVKRGISSQNFPCRLVAIGDAVYPCFSCMGRLL